MSLFRKSLCYLKPTLSSHKIELIAIVLFMLPLSFISMSILKQNSAFWVFEPLFLVVIFLCRRQRALYICSALVPIIGVAAIKFIDTDGEHYFDKLGFWAANLIALIALISENFSKENQNFVRKALNRIINLAFAFIAAHIFYLAVFAVFGGLDYLFDTDLLREEIFARLYMGAVLGVLPILFLAFETSETEYEFTKFLELIINFILTPLLLVYTILLYCYIANIAIFSGLPRGGVAYIVLAYLAGGFALNTINLVLDRQPWAKFFKIFAILAVPAIVLLWIGIEARVREYGLTVDRIYLIASAAFASVIYVSMLFKPLFSYRAVAVFAILATFVTGFVLDVKTIALNSQKQILFAKFKQLNFLDVDGNIRTNIDERELAQLDDELTSRIRDILFYIQNYDSDFANKNKKAIDMFDAGIATIYADKNEYFSLSFAPAKLKVGKEAQVYFIGPGFYDSRVDGPVLKFALDNNQSVDIDLDEHLKDAFGKNDMNTTKLYDPERLVNIKFDLLVFKEENLDVIFYNMELEFNPQSGYKVTSVRPLGYVRQE